MRVRRVSLLQATIAVCLGAPLAGQAQNAEPGATFGLTVGIGHSDNITRVADNEIDESFGTAGFLLNAQREGRLSYNANGEVSYVDYLDDTFDSEVVGGFDGVLTYAFVPERFSWTIEDTFGQAQLNLFQPTTPENRESVNFFSTGPDVSLPLGSRYFFDVGARYADARYEVSELDNNRIGGTLALRRQLSSTSLVALRAQADRIEYDDVVQTEYDVRSAYLRYAIDTSRTLLSIDGGVTELERQDETSNGTLLMLNFSRQLSPATSFTATAGQRFSDASDVFRVLQRRATLDPQTAPTETTSEAFKYRYATLGWNFLKNRTDFSLAVGFNQERYIEDTDRDREYVEYRAEAGRRLSRTLRASIAARWYENQFDNVDFDSDDLRLTGAVSWRLGAHTYLGLQLDYFDRGSTDPDSEFTENRALMTVSYYPRGEQF